MKIVSGGQTGVDRGAIDAALARGCDCGGWCPIDRLAEDGIIPPEYPLQATRKPGYRERTQRNVLDSDGTWLIYFGSLSGGTEETLAACLHFKRPYLLTDAREVPAVRAAALAVEFARSRSVAILNVAGPRISRWPGGADYAKLAVGELLDQMSRPANPSLHDLRG